MVPEYFLEFVTIGHAVAFARNRVRQTLTIIAIKPQSTPKPISMSLMFKYTMLFGT